MANPISQAVEAMEQGLGIASFAGRAADSEWHNMPTRVDRFEGEVFAREEALRAAIAALKAVAVVEGWTAPHASTGGAVFFSRTKYYEVDVPAILIALPQEDA